MLIFWLTIFSLVANYVESAVITADPCTVISGKDWVSPAEARACMTAFPLEPQARANVIEVVSKMLPFHASENYQLQAPPPFEKIHVNLASELVRLNTTQYSSEFEFHLDMQRTMQRANDGHFTMYNYCYDRLYHTFIPLPLVFLTDESNGKRDVFIAPEAFKVASEEFKDQIEFWQNGLPGILKGNLASLSGSKVLLIDGEDPLIAVNDSANVKGVSQAFATRQNYFFASYGHDLEDWTYNMGDFAHQAYPIVDSVQLTVQRPNNTQTDVFTIPYRARANVLAKEHIKDLSSYRQKICIADENTNGADRNDTSASSQSDPDENPEIAFLHQEYEPGLELSKSPMRIQRDGIPSDLPDMDIALPEDLRPKSDPLDESHGAAQFFMLDGNKTGVLLYGSFFARGRRATRLVARRLLQGLQKLKDDGADRLIVDVTNNGGGAIRLSHWLHRILMGYSDKTYPQAGLDTTARAGPLAQIIVEQIITKDLDPRNRSRYNPARWRNAQHRPLPLNKNWLKTGPKLMINGKYDAFSERLGQEAQPFRDTLGIDPPQERLFDPKNILILSNGVCFSSCGLFSVRMAKSHGVRTVVAGGQNNIRQEYTGMIGAQVINFKDIDTEVKSAKLKNHTLAPPDFLSRSAMSVTWRLGYGVNNPNEPEEWQPHWADIAFPLTLSTVNNPEAIWKALASQYLGNNTLFRVQKP
ncbi:hypothetical protein CPB83DRAFT_852655 [Crepidotus variabilis]|uniref:Tail specific protease domain-containing protein n=1 Tax=Crepidotus variabilis TaxID=179855 RepID=A0A9P6EIA7_9AGAR|nr:hypothetical protein CPB83DRAFT_852655 [Crepidotus variabilis]